MTDTDPEGQEEDRSANAPRLSAEDRRNAREEQSLDAKTTLEVIRLEGERELERPSGALFWSGLAAGLAMGFSPMARALLQAHLPDAPWRPLVAALGYSVGFLMVILGSQQLFTENTLRVVVPLLTRRDGRTLANVARVWAVVLAANLLGALAFGWVAARTAVLEEPARHALTELSRRAMEPEFGLTVLRGVFAGWLIALMLWMIPASKSAHLWVIVIVTWVVGAAHLSHVIAGAVEAFYLAALGEQGWGDALGGYVLPSLLGNVIGGTALVAALNHAQAVTGQDA